MKALNLPTGGHYILAVSGGADSMASLHIMATSSHKYRLVVAHFDHGLRSDSHRDRKLVESAAASHQLPFEVHEAKLGKASEATARTARYKWLEQIRAKHGADAIVTAHHQDDLIETSILNLARGSGRQGLAPMQDNRILRPLIGVSRAELRAYAKQHNLTWREDPSNADVANPRNFLRHQLLPHATPEWRKSYLERINKLSTLNKSITQKLDSTLAAHRVKSAEHPGYSFPRELVRDLSLPELEELIASAARALKPGIEFDRRIIQELALFAKTGVPHRRRPLRGGLIIAVKTDAATIEHQ